MSLIRSIAFNHSKIIEITCRSWFFLMSSVRITLELKRCIYIDETGTLHSSQENNVFVAVHALKKGFAVCKTDHVSPSVPSTARAMY